MIKQKRGRNKKAIFFSLDALIALIIILLSILVIYPILKYSQKESYIPEDIISSLSALRIGDINSLKVSQWKIDGNITDLNKSVLEQIGEFYVSTNPTIKSLANELAEEILLTINTNENIGIWYDDDLLASSNTTSFENAKNVNVERQIISGIKEGNATTGYSARAFLTNSVQTKYYYFGGYVGEGNISLNIEYNGSLKNVSLEITANKDFRICINDEECVGSFEPVGSEFEPKNFPLEAYIGSFEPGPNTFKLVPADGISNLHVAGGYLKLTYEDGVQYEQPIKYYFPGIEGLINIYDGFYVPGDLNELEVFLHYNNNNTMFFNIGNVTVFRGNSSGYDKTTLITNTELLSKGLDYTLLSSKTVPIRLALENLSQTTSMISGNADVILITDVSGSMGWRLNSTAGGTTRNNCNDPQLYNNSTKRVSLARCLDKNFTASILSVPGNRVGLVSFSNNVIASHPLSGNLASLNTSINSYSELSSTCICCGINAAYNMLNSSSNSSRQKFIVIMSDGLANRRCTNIQSCAPFNAAITCPGNSNRCFNGTSTSGYDCGNDNCISNFGPSMNNTIWSANRTKVDLNANISSVGFLLSNCHDGSLTLSEVARVGGGVYKLGNSAEELFQAYSDIAASIVSLSYVEQTVNITGNISSILYPDSYIEFNYTRERAPYGIIITEEKKFSDNYTGSFVIPTNSSIVETRVISYSGPRWTKEVSIDNTTDNTIVYNLSEYGSDYIKLGDPYAVNIPNPAVGDSNTVRLTTGISPTNTSAGSEYNKIIYIILKNMVSYSAISEYTDGCNWSVQFEDNTNLTLEVPAGATDPCYYKSDDYAGPTGSSDALKIAVYKLFEKLDLDNNGKLDIKFTEQNLQVSSSEVIGIPFPWETVIQVRKWW